MEVSQDLIAKKITGTIGRSAHELVGLLFLGDSSFGRLGRVDSASALLLAGPAIFLT